MTKLEILEQIFIDYCISNDVGFDVKIILLKKIQERLIKELTLVQ